MSVNKTIEQNIINTLEQNFMPYAMSVIVSRAIPEIDGFKPSHRKLLYTMYKMGLLTGDKTKSANVVGQTMKLNPHGDMAIYETLVRLTRGNDALLLPYIDSKGNFGKQYSRDMSFAAPRYTEVKLEKVCEEIFKDLDKNTVDFTDNYDGSMKEPTLLPTTFPNVITNNNQGIAVGMASNICSFNLKEVCDATIGFMQDEDVDLTEFIKAPDLSTGGQLLYNEKDIREIYETGRGSFKVRGKYRYDKANSCIDIFEIPYTTTSESIIEAVVNLVKEGKIKEITDIRDETDLSGLKITLDIRKSTEPDSLMNKLFRLTPLQDSFSCNFNILVKGSPKVLGIRAILREWLEFRVSCIKRQTLFDIGKKEEKLHLLAGLEKILLDIDKAIKIIRETEREVDVIPNLISGFQIDKIQAEYIAEIKLRNLNREYIMNRIGELDDLKKEIEELKSLHSDDRKIKKLITKQLSEISKKYGKPRRTEIINEEHCEEVSDDNLIEDYNLKLFFTDHNYLKKIPLTSLRVNPEHKMKEDDFILQEIETHNKADLLLFSNKCIVYKLKIYEINDCKASSLGDYLTNLLNLEADEKVVYILATDDYQGELIFAFEDGKFSKTLLENYATKTKRKKLANAYSNKARLVFMQLIKEDIELAAISNIGKLLIFNTSMISLKSTRDSQGIQILVSKKGSSLTEVKQLNQITIKNLDFYRAKAIPAPGHFLKENDNTEKFEQIGLEDLKP